jgi:hypothetical protein
VAVAVSAESALTPVAAVRFCGKSCGPETKANATAGLAGPLIDLL